MGVVDEVVILLDRLLCWSLGAIVPLSLVPAMVEQNRERVCATCKWYRFKDGNPKGWPSAYCDYNEKWFNGRKPPGEREGCEHWK